MFISIIYILFRSLIFRYKTLCHPQCLSLIIINSSLTLLSLSPRLSIRQPKQVISLYSPIDSTIPRYRFSQFEYIGLGGFLHAVEYIHSVLVRLGRSLFLSLELYTTEEVILILLVLLVLYYGTTFLRGHTVELIDCCRGNWLIIIQLER